MRAGRLEPAKSRLQSDPNRPRFTLVVPPDLPDVREELAQVLSSDEARVILARRREERRRRLEPRVSDPRRAERRGRAGAEEGGLDSAPVPIVDRGSATRILYVISPTAPERYQFVRRHFADEPDVEVVYDRRRRERRMGHAPTAAGSRRGDRRQTDIDEDLRAVGWALIHPRDAG